MEGRFVVTALLFTLLAGCSKQEINLQSFQNAQPLQQQQARAAVFASGWETVTEWTTTAKPDEIKFSHTRLMPELNHETITSGTVLVFARDLWADDMAIKEKEDALKKPLMMPFYFLPYLEKPNYTEEWNFTATDGRIDISVAVKGSKNAAPAKQVQMQFVIIPGEVLKAKNQTAQTVRKLSYKQLAETFGLPS